MVRPIIPWPGNKRRLARQILPHFPAHTCYLEPFCGAAALLLMRPTPADAEVINDLNGDLVRLYRVVQHHLEEFIRQFKWSLSSREMFRWASLQHVDTLTDIQRAARFYYLQHLSFGGKVTGQTFGTATTGPVGINLLRIEETLSAVHLRLARVLVENLPWRECIERYDRPHTFVYLDPPYWQTEGYGTPFGWEQYEQIRDTMASLKGRALLSINDHPDVRRLFAGWPMIELATSYTIGRDVATRRPRSELLIGSWDFAGSEES